MAGPVALVGAGEFLPTMAEVDTHLLEAVGRPRPRVAVVPTAAAQEGADSVNRWAEMGIAHFRALGAVVEAVMIEDRVAAADPDRARALAAADLVYFSGGDPAYLVETLLDTTAWTAIARAHAAGAALAGCSAGAMALAGTTLDFRASRAGPIRWRPGWGVAPSLAILAHYDRLLHNRAEWVDTLVASAPAGTTVVGIDEHTALVGQAGVWRVMGLGGVTIYEPGGPRRSATGAAVKLPG